MTEKILRVTNLSAGYGDMTVLRDVHYDVELGTVTAVAGANGAGKTTMLKATLGLLESSAGTIEFRGHDVTRMPVSGRIGLGMGIVPEGRGLFATMSVHDNLRLGARAGGLRGERLNAAIDRVLDLFPVLADKSSEHAGRLSGGQQQQLSLARTLAAGPSLVLLDEPSMGLAPKVWSDFLSLARSLADDGRAVVLAEQKIRPVLAISDRCVVLQRGEVKYAGAADDSAAEDWINKAYLESAPTVGAHHD